jgi:prepilin-type N-terminal cleavage/methylation domain-containing protein
MTRLNSASHRSRGFSLIEVMIAVVVLTTGLLALAALQGSLTRNSAEAKVRGRVAAMLSARMDELRSTGYGTLVSGTPTVINSTTDPCDGDATDWIDCTRIQAGLASLSVTTTVSTWAGATTFTSPSTPGPDDAQFKRVILSASWKGAADSASANSHQLVIASDISPLGLTNTLIPPPDDQASGGGGPTVRTVNPATAGVIPIAMGNGNSTAASNPTPELVGQSNNQEIVGTKFNVLTYTPEGNAAVIQKRFENEIIKCACTYGVGGTNLPEIYRTAQWPAIWTGDSYEVYKPSPAANAPGQALSSGPRSGVEQSALCQECCRDHHDNSTAGVVKFDPERSDGLTSKYDLNGANILVPVNNTVSGDYYNACRVIRVDGFWRTASDAYSRQFGLLETETVSGAQAKTGLPTTTATTAYTTFVKDYLKQYDGTVATAPANAQAMFDDVTRGLNNPTLVSIAAPNTTDYRYLHSRGLYVDYLEAEARQKLRDVLADTEPQGRCPTGTDLAECVLPYLPFTSANLTEIATWLASDSTVLAVNSGNLLELNPAEPSGSRTYGKRVGTANNTATVRQSNSGAAINTVLTTLAGVDPTDDSAVSNDVQPFDVGGAPGTGTGDNFFVRVSGGGQNPFVFYSIAADNGECIKPAGSDHDCGTNSTLPLAGAIRLGNYWVETTTSRSISAACVDNQGNSVTATATIPVPTFRNYEVVSATIGGVGGTIGSPLTDNKETETTTITFGSIAANDLILVTLAEQTGSPTYATVASCTTNGGANQINNPTWVKSWELP